MWPSPGPGDPAPVRFHRMKASPPVPRPSSIPVVLTTTSSPTATGPSILGNPEASISEVSANRTRTRIRSVWSSRSSVTTAFRNAAIRVRR